MKPGNPPAGGTATLDLPDTDMKPQMRSKHPARQILEWAADLRITVALFVFALFIVFWGTLAQVDFGIWTVVGKYFRSFFVWVPLKVVLFNATDDMPGALPFPGGWLVGTLMMINLLAAHAIRFKLTWSRAGIIMIHVGIIVMMVGELVTGLCAVEGSLVIPEGRSSNTVIHAGQAELAIIHNKDAKSDQVVTIPISMLKEPGAVISDPALPFRIEVVHSMVNTLLLKAKGKKTLATHGVGRDFIAKSDSEVSGVDPNQKHDQPSVYLKLTGRDGKALGLWLFSVHQLFDNQWVHAGGKDYHVRLRFKETTRDFNMHLTKFTHAVYPGTNTPKDFHSYIDLTDSAGTRSVEIYMNAPLYYNGETFYQSSWTTDGTGKADGTVLQVVRNPGWVMPYLSCAIVGLGMLVHFGLTLYRFLDRRIVR